MLMCLECSVDWLINWCYDYYVYADAPFLAIAVFLIVWIYLKSQMPHLWVVRLYTVCCCCSWKAIYHLTFTGKIRKELSLHWNYCNLIGLEMWRVIHLGFNVFYVQYCWFQFILYEVYKLGWLAFVECLTFVLWHSYGHVLGLVHVPYTFIWMLTSSTPN